MWSFPELDFDVVFAAITILKKLPALSCQLTVSAFHPSAERSHES